MIITYYFATVHFITSPFFRCGLRFAFEGLFFYVEGLGVDELLFGALSFVVFGRESFGLWNCE